MTHLNLPPSGILQETVPVDDATRGRMALTAAAASAAPSQMVPGNGGAPGHHGPQAFNATQLPALLGCPTQAGAAAKAAGAGPTQRGAKLGGAELEMQDAGTVYLPSCACWWW